MGSGGGPPPASHQVACCLEFCWFGAITDIAVAVSLAVHFVIPLWAPVICDFGVATNDHCADSEFGTSNPSGACVPRYRGASLSTLAARAANLIARGRGLAGPSALRVLLGGASAALLVILLSVSTLSFGALYEGGFTQ